MRHEQYLDQEPKKAFPDWHSGLLPRRAACPSTGSSPEQKQEGWDARERAGAPDLVVRAQTDPVRNGAVLLLLLGQLHLNAEGLLGRLWSTIERGQRRAEEHPSAIRTLFAQDATVTMKFQARRPFQLLPICSSGVQDAVSAMSFTSTCQRGDKRFKPK